MVLVVKNLSANVGDIRDEGSILESGRSPGGGYDTLLQYSCLENPMDRGAWWATVHEASESWMRLSEHISFTFFLMPAVTDMVLGIKYCPWNTY